VECKREHPSILGRIATQSLGVNDPIRLSTFSFEL
jgi:hypothetical protein